MTGLFISLAALGCVNTTSAVDLVREVASIEFRDIHEPDWLNAAHLRCPISEGAQITGFIRALCSDCAASISRAHSYNGMVTHSKLRHLEDSVTERTLELAIRSLGGSDWQVVNYELDAKFGSSPDELGLTLFSLETQQLVRVWTSSRK